MNEYNKPPDPSGKRVDFPPDMRGKNKERHEKLRKIGIAKQGAYESNPKRFLSESPGNQVRKLIEQNKDSVRFITSDSD